MAYGPLDQVIDYNKQFTTYIFATATNTIYDFGAVGYLANAVLNVPANGQVQLFGYDALGNVITVNIAGVSVVLNGTGSAFMLRDPTDGTKAYITYNLPNTQNAVYTFRALFSKSGGAQMSVVWTNQTSN